MPMQATAAPLTKEDVTAIRSIISKFDEDMLAGNSAAVADVYTDDAVLFPPNSPMVRGRADIRQFFDEFPKVTEFRQHPIEIVGEGELAFPWGTYELVVLPPGATRPVRDEGKVLAVWRKQPDGSWRIHRACWNSDSMPGT